MKWLSDQRDKTVSEWQRTLLAHLKMWLQMIIFHRLCFEKIQNIPPPLITSVFGEKHIPPYFAVWSPSNIPQESLARGAILWISTDFGSLPQKFTLLILGNFIPAKMEFPNFEIASKLGLLAFKDLAALAPPPKPLHNELD